MPQTPGPLIDLHRRNQLVEAHLALVDHIAKRLMQRLPPSFDYEDLRQNGYLGLIDAAEKYSPKRRVPFHVYAAYRIRGSIMEFARRRHYRNATMCPIGERELEIADPRSAYAETNVHRGELHRLVQQARHALNDTNRQVIEIYFDREEKLKGVGAACGVRQSRSSQLLQIAKREVRKQLEWRGLKEAA